MKMRNVNVISTIIHSLPIKINFIFSHPRLISHTHSLRLDAHINAIALKVFQENASSRPVRHNIIAWEYLSYFFSVWRVRVQQPFHSTETRYIISRVNIECNAARDPI